MQSLELEVFLSQLQLRRIQADSIWMNFAFIG